MTTEKPTIKMTCPACEKEYNIGIDDIGDYVECDCGCTWVWMIEMYDFFDPEG